VTDQLRPEGPPQVEPLSDVAWARVERGLWARMDGSTTPPIAPARSRRWMWIAGPIAAAAAAAIVFVAVARDSTPATEKGVASHQTGSDATDVRVVSPPNAPASASFDDAHVELAPATAIVMRSSATVLERGSAWFAVAPRVDRPAFVVLAGDTKVRVVGTRFRVSRAEELVAVDVDHGVVEVQFRGSLIQVRANESWSSERPEAVSPLKTAAITQPQPPPEPEPELAPSKLQPKITPKPEPKKPEPKPEPRPEPKPEALEDERTKYERLTALEKRDPSAAMAGYLELSQRSGAWAANALYAAGRLAVDRRDPRAKTLLTVYVRRFPAGPNVADARALLARLSAGSR
jgi:hypothetical protein